MVAANKRVIKKLLVIFAVVSDNGEGIATVHLLMVLLLGMHVNMLLMGNLRPVTVARRGPFSRVMIHVHVMYGGFMRDVMLIKLLEERSS
jgi:hypothetical protein